MRPTSRCGRPRRAGSSRATCALSTSASATGWGRWQRWPRWGSRARWWCNAGDRGAGRENADCGFRIADLQGEVVRDGADPDNPQSAIRNPQLRGEVAVRVGVDVGGTFTDLVALADNGEIAVRKVVTTPHDPGVGMFRAIELLSAPVDILVHGTTIATNALLERRGARVVLVTTRGFEDLLWLRRQDRVALYDLAKHHPEPLVARRDVIGVRERMGPDGAIAALSESEVPRGTAEVGR